MNGINITFNIDIFANIQDADVHTFHELVKKSFESGEGMTIYQFFDMYKEFLNLEDRPLHIKNMMNTCERQNQIHGYPSSGNVHFNIHG